MSTGDFQDRADAKDFAAAVQADREHHVWSGDWQGLGGEWPPAESLVEPTREMVDGIAVVRFSTLPTAATWKRLAATITEAAEDANVQGIVLMVNVRASQVAGLRECCGAVRLLAKKYPIVAQVDHCLGAAMSLLEVCSKRYGSGPETQFGGLVLGTPFDRSTGG